VDAKIARPCPYRVNEKDIIGLNVLPIQYRYSGKTEFSALKWETPVSSLQKENNQFITIEMV
jgi:hypothetical protein